MNYSIFQNLKIKIIVLCIAILVWFFVKSEDKYTYSLDIPLRVSDLEPNYIIENEIPQKIKVIAWGKGRDLVSLIIRKDIFYNLNVSKIHRSAKMMLDRDQVKFMHENEIDVLSIVSPESVFITLAELVSKKVPLVPEVNIQTVPGYTVVDEIKLEPDSILVQGLKAEIKDIFAVYTEKKSYKNIKQDIKKTIRLKEPEKKNVTLSAHAVTLTADVQKLMEKPISEILVAVINQPSNLKVSVIPSTLSLVLEGGVDVLLNVTKAQVQAYIDYHKIQSSRQKNHLAYIVTPKGVRYRDVKPKRFQIVVEKIE